MNNSPKRAAAGWMKWALATAVVLAIYSTWKYVSFYRYVNKKKHEYVHRYDRDKLFEMLPRDTSDIIFIGNSLTEHFELVEYFNNVHVRNRGIGGDSTAGVLARLQPITAGRPSKIFIEVGINDLSAGTSIQDILRDYGAIIAWIARESPATKIYIQSVLPVSKAKEIPACREGCNNSVVLLNAGLKKLADGRQVSYIDLYSSFVDPDGGLADSLQTDGIHLSGKGYALWAKIVRPHVDE